MSQLDLAERRAEIINSVLSKGLFPGSYLSKRKSFQYMGSKDKKPVSNVDGVFIPSYNYLMEQHGGGEELILRYSLGGHLYEQDFGVLPVVAERPNDDIYTLEDADFRRVISERASASLLLICLADESWIAKNIRRVKTDRFSKVVFPSKIWDEYNSRQDSQRLLGKFSLSIIEYMPKTLLTNVGNNETRESEVLVPDYESAIRLFMLDNKDRHLWIHGVRLPVERNLNTSSTC